MNQEAIKGRCDETRAWYFSIPCVLTLYWFVIHLVPFRNDIFHLFPHDIPNLDSPSLFIVAESCVKVTNYVNCLNFYLIFHLWDGGPTFFFFRFPCWHIDIEYWEIFTTFGIFRVVRSQCFSLLWSSRENCEGSQSVRIPPEEPQQLIIIPSPIENGLFPTSIAVKSSILVSSSNMNLDFYFFVKYLRASALNLHPRPLQFQDIIFIII